MGSLKRLYDHEKVLARWKSFLSGDRNDSSKKDIQKYKEKGGVDFIRTATELLDSALDNVEANIHPDDANQRIVDSTKALIFAMLFDETTNPAGTDIVPISQMFTNYSADVYQGLKANGKYATIIKELNVDFEISSREEEQKMGGKLK